MEARQHGLELLLVYGGHLGGVIHHLVAFIVDAGIRDIDYVNIINLGAQLLLLLKILRSIILLLWSLPTRFATSLWILSVALPVLLLLVPEEELEQLWQLAILVDLAQGILNGKIRSKFILKFILVDVFAK